MRCPTRSRMPWAWRSACGSAPRRTASSSGWRPCNLLAEVAEEAPLLCLVDDAQWLDEASAQVLAFVARRVAAERVALVFAVRDSDAADDHPFAGLPELRLEGLGETDAQTLLATAVHTPLDDVVRDRIVAEARGNPLALLELPARRAGRSQLAGGFELPDARGVPRRIEDGFRAVRQACRPTPSCCCWSPRPTRPARRRLLWRAAARLGIDPDAAAPAEAAGLLEIDTRVRFRHPLVRSAVYRAATAAGPAPRPRGAGRRHRSARRPRPARLAPGAGGAGHRRGGRRRAGALGRAGAGARRAGRRGGVPAAGDRADPGSRRPCPAGARGRARQARGRCLRRPLWNCWPLAASGPLDALQRARLALLRAQIAFHRTRGSEATGHAARGGQDARPAGRRAVPRDLPARARCGHHHRRLERGRGVGRRPSSPGPHRGRGPPRPVGPAPRRAGDRRDRRAMRRGVPELRPRARGLLGTARDRSGRRPHTAAGCGSPAARRGHLRRRAAPRVGQPQRRARPRGRRTGDAPCRAVLPVDHVRAAR